MKNKYILQLSLEISGRVVVKAKDRKEAEEIGEKILDKAERPKWWEWGGQGLEKVSLVTKNNKKLIKKELIPEFNLTESKK